MVNGDQVKTGIFNPGFEIIAIDADMIRLPENGFAAGGIGYGRVLEGGRRAVLLRDGKNGDSPLGQNAVNFSQGPSVIRHVLENIAGDQDIETSIGNLVHIRYIYREIDIFP
jgi:hypothetical protein